MVLAVVLTPHPRQRAVTTLPGAAEVVMSAAQRTTALLAAQRGRCILAFLLRGHHTTLCGGRPALRRTTGALGHKDAPHNDRVSKETGETPFTGKVVVTESLRSVYVKKRFSQPVHAYSY